MFSVGEKVVYKANAVCVVEALETPSFVKDADKKYYKLRCLFSNGNEIVYVPVDSQMSMRSVMTEDEGKKCFDFLKNEEIEDFHAKQPALIMAHFQHILSDGSIESTLTVLKEILIREHQCALEGKRLRQAEEHYLAIVEKALSEELSLVLGKEIEEVKVMIRNAVFDE